MSPPASDQIASGGFFYDALTNAVLTGVVSWVSLFVTIAGFWLAIAQIRKVKTASDAAKDATLAMVKVVQSREQAAKLAEALSHMKLARTYMHMNPGASGAYIDSLCNSLVDAHHLLGAAPDHPLVLHILKLREAASFLQVNATPTVPPQRAKKMHSDLLEATMVVERLMASIRYEMEA